MTLPPVVARPRAADRHRTAISAGAAALVVLVVAGILFTVERTPPERPLPPMTVAAPRVVTFPSTAAPSTSSTYPPGWPERPPPGVPEDSPTSLWTADIPPGPEPTGSLRHAPWEGPYVVGYTVMVRTWESKLLAFDARTGAKSWTLDLTVAGVVDRGTTPIHGLPAGAETFAIAENGLLRAIDVQDGSVRWSALTEPQGGFAANGSQVVFPVNGRIRSVDTVSGARRWDVDARVAEASASFAFGSDLVVISSSGTVRGLDLTTGDERWITHPDVDGAAIMSVSTDAVWLADGRGDLLRLDPRDGSLRIELQIEEDDRRIRELLAQADGTVIVRTPPALLAISRSGNVLWHMRVGSTDVRQVLIGDAFVTLTPFGLLVSDLVTGTPRVAWRFGPPQVYSTPVVTADALILIVPQRSPAAPNLRSGNLTALPLP